MKPESIANLVATLVTAVVGICAAAILITSCRCEAASWKEGLSQLEKEAEEKTKKSFLHPEKVGYIKGIGDCYRVEAYFPGGNSDRVYFVSGRTTETLNRSNGKGNNDESIAFIK